MSIEKFRPAIKPIVKYKTGDGTVGWTGRRAWIIPLDHPRVEVNGQLVATSSVIEDTDVGSQANFETKNTRYVREDI